MTATQDRLFSPEKVEGPIDRAIRNLERLDRWVYGIEDRRSAKGERGSVTLVDDFILFCILLAITASVVGVALVPSTRIEVRDGCMVQVEGHAFGEDVVTERVCP